MEEPEVIFVEEIDEEKISDVEIIPETRNIIPVEDVVEIVVEKVVKPSLNIVEKLESEKYFVQIATYSKVENVEKILSIIEEAKTRNYPEHVLRYDLDNYVKDLIDKLHFTEGIENKDYSITKHELDYLLKDRYNKMLLFERGLCPFLFASKFYHW